MDIHFQRQLMHVLRQLGCWATDAMVSGMLLLVVLALPLHRRPAMVVRISAIAISVS